ncbi:MAG: peptidase [Gammaproteobacteria bacterium]|nr:MAG: peptidase [Gammaproteobacteria bacterium]
MKLFCSNLLVLNFARHAASVSVLGALTVLMASLLSSCGGGKGSQLDNLLDNPDSGGSSNTWQSGTYKPQSTFANKCAAPRKGIDPETKKPFLDSKGKLVDERNFLRSWSNDTYLWYNEIVDVNPNTDMDPMDYFALLKTNAKTDSGNDKDKFHFTYDSLEWYNLSVAGIAAGYGMELSWINSAAPNRNVVVAYTEPGSSAAAKNVKRGAKIIKIDGYDFINGNTQEIVDKLNAGLFPATTNETHTFEIQNVGAATTEEVILTSANITKTPVQNVKTIDTGTGKVGYFLFNDHIATAERGLYDAVNQLSTEGITDLVLDVRYNGGGYLYLASELSYMIAGSTTEGKFFEKIIFNDKHPTKDIFGENLTPTPFYNASESIGGSLPTLNLSRVYVITSADTCSASESIINGLRGVGVEVIQIGSKTCGKPYGFYPQDNCGTTYFTIQFKGVNNKGFGEYSDGFTPSSTDNEREMIKGCSVADDLTHQLGDEAEKNLAVALNYRATGTCALPENSSSFKLQKTSAPDDLSEVSGSVNKPVGLTNRIMK